MKKLYAFLLMTDQGPQEARTLPGEGMDTLFIPVRRGALRGLWPGRSRRY